MRCFILPETKFKSMKGLSPLIGMVLVIAFGFAAMTIVLTVVNPLLNRAKDFGVINEATQNMQLLDSVIKAVASEAKGSKRTVHVKITEGVLRSNQAAEQIYFEFEPRTKTNIDGFSGDVKIESRPIFLEYFNQYSESSNASDTWTAVNGSWSISSGRFLGTGGIAYHSVGNQQGFDIAAKIVSSSSPDGQVYVIPGDPRDLVLFLPFDGNINTTITTAYDYSAYKNNGTLINETSATCYTSGACPTWIVGKFGNATSYDGVGDLTNITGANQFNSASFSVAFWISPGSLRTQGIIGKTTVPTNQRWRIFMVDTGGKIEFDATGDIGNVQTATNLATGTWYHIVGTYDGTNARLYVNGVWEKSAPAASMYNNNMNHIEIAPSETNRFNGTIDEVMMWNRNLTDSEIAFLYESSTRKITIAGEIPNIGQSANTTIVLASPGSSYFDNVKLKSGPPKIRFVVPYQNIDIVNQTRFGPGDHDIVVRHYGTNTTSNRPMIGVEE